ncbi:MAG: outer membrane beta-barrel protein [Ignavibacteria bacterium]|nr:outer membrane beta-barrel protein [Ignavibacteria bacterium]
MKKVLVLLILAALTFSFGNAQAQKIKLNIIGGYSLPLPDLKGTFPDDVDKSPTPYMMKSGFNVGGVGKYYFDKKNSIGLTLSLLYNGFSQNVDNPSTLVGVSNVKFNMNNFQIGLGGEYRIPVKGAVVPFFDVDLTANILSGKSRVTPTGYSEIETKMKSATRFGFNVGVGAEFIASSKISFVVGGKYQFMNLIGKDYTEDVSGSDYNLNDKEWTDALGTVHKARNMMAIQIYGGINFNLDQIFKK